MLMIASSLVLALFQQMKEKIQGIEFTVIKLPSMRFILVLQSSPIRSLYILDRFLIGCFSIKCKKKLYIL